MASNNEKDRYEREDYEGEGSEVNEDGRFECQVCGKSYAQLAGLSRHILTHNDENFKSAQYVKSTKQQVPRIQGPRGDL